MPYGHLTKDMEAAIFAQVRGKRVVDLGAGDGAYTEKLLQLGASHVIAVDKEYALGRVHDRPGVTIVPGYFEHVGPTLPPFDVAFLSWPQNYRMPGLVEILERAKVAIYLGSNHHGDACGFPGLFRHLVSRRLVVALEHRRNTLIIVDVPEPRTPTLEEQAGLDPLAFSPGPL